MHDPIDPLNRRRLIQGAGMALLGLAATPLRGLAQATATLAFANGERELIAYPQKRPLLRTTSRPPQLETPFEVFNEGVLTPNDAFYVRYHLANIPTSVDAAAHRLKVSGRVKQPLSLSVDELKALGEPVELVAVNQCSGNGRGFFAPRVAGGQLGNGAMGNARWTGVPLKTVLEHAGVLGDAKQVSYRGLDQPVLPATPAFIKALDIDHALSGEPMIAWAMNGAELPLLNGYPIKMVVPGYFGTYWVKHLSEIEVLDHSFDGFFMATAYKVPDNDCQCVPAGEAAARTRPIARYKVRSFITSLRDGAVVPAGKPLRVKGIAFDGGSGIKTVELSADGGKSWKPAVLGQDLGRFSFREWQLALHPKHKGPMRLLVRATSQQGETQAAEPLWNPAGYARNVIESVQCTVA